LKKLKSEISEIEGIFRIDIPIPFDMKSVCLYLFDIDDKKVLIDAGLNIGDWGKVFINNLKDMDLTLKDIDYCLVTHSHLDHAGLIKKLKRRNPNICIMMSGIADEVIRWQANRENDKEIEDAARTIADEMVEYGISEKYGNRIVKVFTQWPQLYRYQKPDVLLNDGDEIKIGSKKLKVIWTPGHTLGHICIFDIENRYLFSGDHILSRITPHIGAFAISSDQRKKYAFNNILDSYLKSLDIIDNLNAKIIFPAHQEVIYNPHQRILEIKEHHKNRLNEISKMIESKPLTPAQISKQHFGTDLDDINKFLAINEVLSHLIYLEHQEKVKRVEKNEKFYFYS
jgi:glyoxylase-like metal-dependent hydrolase (beta-lactamase superfamily II)